MRNTATSIVINSCRMKADQKQEVLSQVIFCRNSEHGAVMDEDEHIRIRTVSAKKPAKTDSRALSIITMGLVTVVLLASAYVLEAKPVLALLNGAPILVLGDPE
jgi:DNA-directed RNA polymerase subunit E'/Rpb7